MGTNYYLRKRHPFPFGRGQQYHLGKSSAGWSFTFHAFQGEESPLPGGKAVNDFASWRELLDLGRVYDEYDRHVPKGVLLALIEKKRDGLSTLYRDDFLDSDGNRFVNGEFS